MTNLEKVKQAMEAGFIYQSCNIIEIYRDEFVYLKRISDGQSFMHRIDFVADEWEKTGRELQEKKDAKEGNSIVTRYFKEHGVLGFGKLSGQIYSAHIIYDGKPTPGNTWNSSISMMNIISAVSNQNNYINKIGKVETTTIGFQKREEDLMDATMQDGKPHLRHCHKTFTQPHEKTEYKSHFGMEEWTSYKKIALAHFTENLHKIILEKPIQFVNKGSRTLMHQEGSNFIFMIEQEVGENYGWEYLTVKVTTMEILSTGKYRNDKLELSTVPKFTGTTTKEVIITEIMNMYSEIEIISGANNKFKYK